MSASVFEKESIVAEVAVDRAARRLADGQQAAHLAARVPAAGRRAGPGRGLVGDDRVRRAVRARRRRRRSASRRRAARRRSGRSRRAGRAARRGGPSGRSASRRCAGSDEIVLFRPASSEAIFSTSPPGPAIASYWPWAVSCAATICERTEWIESVSAPAFCTSACLAAALSGDFERSDHAFQNFDELGVDAVVAGLGERQLGGVERLGLGLPVVQARVLAAELEVQELVADAAEALDVDAGAEVGAGRRCRAGDLQLQRLRGRRAWPPGASSRRSRRWRCCGRSCRSSAAGP